MKKNPPEKGDLKKKDSENIVRFEELYKTYLLGSVSVPVLHGISISIARGEFVGIMGPSGSGKSTVLNILGLLDRPTEGRYILNGKNVAELEDDTMAKLRNSQIGFIFQSFNLFPHLSVEQNIEVPMVYGEVDLAERKKKAKALAREVGLGPRLSHKPSELSGGERQRVAVARALANNPSFLLADEPTGNLDEATSADIMRLLKNLHDQGATIIMVTHDPEFESFFERTIRLRDGRVENN